MLAMDTERPHSVGVCNLITFPAQFQNMRYEDFKMLNKHQRVVDIFIVEKLAKHNPQSEYHNPAGLDWGPL